MKWPHKASNSQDKSAQDGQSAFYQNPGTQQRGIAGSANIDATESLQIADAALSNSEKLVLVVVMLISVSLLVLYIWADQLLGWCGKSCIEAAKAIIPNLVATGVSFVAAYYFAKRLQNLQFKRTELATLRRIDHVVNQSTERAIANLVEQQCLSSLDDICEHLLRSFEAQRDLDEEVKGILSLKYKHDETNWEHLLSGASSVEFCMYHTNTYWFRNNEAALQQLLRDGGKVTVYLPDTSGIEDRFRTRAAFDDAIKSKINLSSQKFRDLAVTEEEKSRVHVRTARRGFNYFLARITKSDHALILISPYSNNYEKTDSPTLLLDQERASPSLKHFIEAEFRLLESGGSVIDPARERLIVWPADNRKVFLSTMLECSAGCKFCYVDSLVTRASSGAPPLQTAATVLRELLNAPQFRQGAEGTVIMLGGFTDPFLRENIEASAYLIEQLSSRGNWIHIATRLCIPDEMIDSTVPTGRNIVINYSVSSLKGRRLEIGNHSQRFNQAKELRARGIHISLFVRPIIPGVTIKDIDGIAQLAVDAGIESATLGGLYVDSRIDERMSAAGFDQGRRTFQAKRFVLDTDGRLQKIGSQDIREVEKRLRERGFTVFMNADERIEHYRRGA